MANKREKELTRESLVAECEDGGLECFLRTEKSLDGLLQYLGLLMKWNRVMNLVGKSRWDEALRTLIADSAFLYPFLTSLQGKGSLAKAPLTWDLGAGAGLPGIPLRLLWQDGRYTLVDSREKRTLFLKTVLASHDYGETEVVQARVEDFFPAQPQAQMIISRAFMPWEQVLELVAPYTTNGGLAVFLTLLPAPKEYALEGLDAQWKLVDEKQYSIQGDSRYLWALRLDK